MAVLQPRQCGVDVGRRVASDLRQALRRDIKPAYSVKLYRFAKILRRRRSGVNK